VSDLRSSDARRRAARRQLEARDGRACARCGDAIDAGETPSLGHVVARALGGSDALANLRLEHLICNQRAGVDRDRARIVAAASSSVFHSAAVAPTEPSAAWNGARIGTDKRTTVRFVLITREIR
jgi:hypothetical protein